MYSTAATKPASSSCGSVPVSKRCPNGSSAAGLTLYGRQRSRSSDLAYARPMCGPYELVRLRRSDVPFRVRAEHQLSTVSVHLHGRAWTYSRHRTGTRQVHGTAVNFSPSNLNSAGRPFSL